MLHVPYTQQSFRYESRVRYICHSELSPPPTPVFPSFSAKSGIRPTTSRTSIPTGSEPMGSKRAGLFSQLFSPMVLKPKSNRSRQPGPARWSKPHKVSSLSTNRASRRTSISVKKWSIFCLVSVGMRQLLRTLTTTDEMVGSLLDVVTDEER